MASQSEVTSLFKRVYGDLTNLLPQDFPLAKDIPFSAREKVGEKYICAAVLTAETGWTLSSSTSAFELNPARAGVIKQTEVSPYISVLPSIIPWSVMSRTADAGEKAFYSATKFLVSNNLKSHGRLQEILRLYGQSDALLGYVSYATATYRGVSFTTGTGTLTLQDATTLAFTNGINAASKAILMAPGQFASFNFVGLEGVKINEVDSTGAIIKTGSLVSVNSELGYITVDFTPTAASSTTSHRICFDGMESANDYVGIQKILSTTGTLFAINTATYSLWQGNRYNCNNQKLTLARFQAAVANMVNKGGFRGDLKVYVNPRTWATLATTEAGLRVYDKSYSPSKADNGFDSIEFFTQAGKAEFIPHPGVKEGDAFALSLKTWSRSGSSEISFSIPGMPTDVIFPMTNQAGYCFRSFSDQFIFCDIPVHNLYFYNINDESSS